MCIRDSSGGDSRRPGRGPDVQPRQGVERRRRRDQRPGDDAEPVSYTHLLFFSHLEVPGLVAPIAIRKTKHFISSLARHQRAFDSGHCAATSSYLYGMMRLMADSLVTLSLIHILR